MNLEIDLREIKFFTYEELVRSFAWEIPRLADIATFNAVLKSLFGILLIMLILVDKFIFLLIDYY
ncbi:hypothetical protein J5U23_02182 [Saccharolobus shibatae B12]|uniref:Uncharacterized protein n=1 Tax=Saccharolobus shibatae (strain ATCC 51178 / DSM 5389 / JCM 8931 / NBRC 15437 / B12) TaxID=523848 RepID=A0A8F5BPY0_SACSH|nr:hypothetical protein J5U23_02182 [Saccharolobus shibatae B12]